MLLVAVLLNTSLIVGAIAALLYVFGLPLLILATFKQQANPTVKRLGNSLQLPSVISKQFEIANEELGSLGFQLEDTLHIPQQTDNVQIVLRLYTNRDAKDLAIVVTMLTLVDEAWRLGTQYFEFSTYFRDGSEYNTNNTQEVGAFKTPPNTIASRAPWIANCRDLYRAHCLIIQSEAGSKEKELQLATKFHEDAAAYLAFGIKKELESAESDGYLKLNADGGKFVPTVVGAYLMAWAQIWPFKRFVNGAAERKCRNRLARAGFQER